jgi:transcription elongation factor GreA
MNRSIQPSKDYFNKQLVYIDENIKDLTDLYITSTPMQERIKHFFTLYSLEVEDFINTNSKKGTFPSLPKVYIGTKVTLLYDGDNEIEDYVICFPEQSDPDGGYISFLSPVGRQVLLKNIGDKVALKIPTGDLWVTIKEISFVGHLLDVTTNSKEA